MERTETIDHKMEVLNDQSSNGSPLSRQVTVTMSSDQYERLFFQPSGPAKGDFAKRFGNPTLLGLICFLIPYTSTIFILIGWGGAEPPTSLAGLSGDYYFLGSIGMVLAGIAEFILGNTYPFAVFVIFGAHWGSLAYTQDPIHQTAVAFAKVGGLTGPAYNSSQAFHNVTMCLVACVLLVGTLRINVPFVLVFIGLVFLFAFIAAADFAVPTAATEADLAHIALLLRIGGGFGMLGVINGWYLALLTVMEAVGLPSPLPVFDLSSKVFPTKDKDLAKHADHAKHA